MTLAATLALGRHFFLVGDLLIAGRRVEEVDHPTVNTPTLPDINSNLSLTSGHAIRGLARKLALLSDRFAIGWSGTEISAKMVIKEIKSAIANNPKFDYHNLTTLLESLWTELGRTELSLCGIMIEGSTARIFGRDAKCFNLSFAQIMACGSGADPFCEIASSMPPNPDVEANLTSATCTLASWVGMALGEQMRVGEGMQYYYGGGFEILFVEHGVIKAVPEITYFFLQVTREEAGTINFEFEPIIKVMHYGDILIMRRFRPRPVHSKLSNNEIYFLRPMNREVQGNEIETLKQVAVPLSSQFTGIYVNFLNAAEKDRITFFMDYYAGADSQRAVEFVERDAEVEINLSDNLTERILARAATVYAT
jgi:hypothetical protein